MAARRSEAGQAAPEELLLTRVFDAPRKLVFEAWTRPEHLMAWWGPNGFTLPVCELDFRPGGAYRFVMRAPDGAEYPMQGIFREIDAPSRIVFGAILEGEPREILTTVTFAEQDGKTTLTVHQTRPHDEMKARGQKQGWTEQLERLARFVGENTADREIAATRIFDAPRDLVFRMWTEPQHVARWWGPNGFTITIQKMDVRAGGVWEFVMHGPDGRDYDNKFVYVEIARPERIVYDHVTGPLFHATATFAEQGDKTRVTVRMLFESAALRDRVVSEFNAVEGLQQTLARLGEALAK